MTWIDAGRVGDIPRLGARVLRVHGQQIAVFRTSQDEIFALRDSCPHRGGPLSQGIVHGQCVTCPLHDWVIDLTTGQAAGPDEGGTYVYEVRMQQGSILIAIPDQALRLDLPDEDLAAEAG